MLVKTHISRNLCLYDLLILISARNKARMSESFYTSSYAFLYEDTIMMYWPNLPGGNTPFIQYSLISLIFLISTSIYCLILSYSSAWKSDGIQATDHEQARHFAGNEEAILLLELMASSPFHPLYLWKHGKDVEGALHLLAYICYCWDTYRCWMFYYF